MYRFAAGAQVKPDCDQDTESTKWQRFGLFAVWEAKVPQVQATLRWRKLRVFVG